MYLNIFEHTDGNGNSENDVNTDSLILSKSSSSDRVYKWWTTDPEATHIEQTISFLMPGAVLVHLLHISGYNPQHVLKVDIKHKWNPLHLADL